MRWKRALSFSLGYSVSSQVLWYSSPIPLYIHTNIYNIYLSQQIFVRLFCIVSICVETDETAKKETNISNKFLTPNASRPCIYPYTCEKQRQMIRKKKKTKQRVRPHQSILKRKKNEKRKIDIWTAMSCATTLIEIEGFSSSASRSFFLHVTGKYMPFFIFVWVDWCLKSETLANLPRINVYFISRDYLSPESRKKKFCQLCAKTFVDWLCSIFSHLGMFLK